MFAIYRNRHLTFNFFFILVTSAEVKMAAAIVDNNVPFAAADTFSPLFKDMFPDSEIASPLPQQEQKQSVSLMEP